MSINSNAPLENDEISLKELILKMKEWMAYLRTKWIVILLVAVIGGGIGFACAIFQNPTLYTATLTFALEEEKTGGTGIAGALGLVSSLGFDLGGGGGGAFNGANLMELMKSRALVERALLQPIIVNKKTASLATYFIRYNQLNENWKKKPELKNIRFDPLADRSIFTLQQDSILGILYNTIVGKKGLLSVLQKDKKVSIISIEVKSTNELFSKVFAETIAKVVSDFYIDTKSKKAKLNYDILQKQTDSVRKELNGAITGVAVANDNTYNLNPALNIKRVPSAKRQVDVQANSAILTQLVANLEMAKVTLRKETPLIQIIDKPILPLEKYKMSKLKSIIIGLLIGFFIINIVLIINRIWKLMIL